MRLVVWILRALFPAGRRRRSRRRRADVLLLAGLSVFVGLLVGGSITLSRRLVPPLPAASRGVLLSTPTPSLPLLRPLPPGYDPAHAVTERVYVPVTSIFNMTRSDITLADLRARWRQAARLVVTEEAAKALETRWGPAGDGVLVMPDSPAVSRQLLDTPDAVGIVAFDELTPAVRTLALDGMDPLDRTVSNGLWPLRVTWGVTAGEVFVETARRTVPPTNREPDAIGMLVLTGVTVLPVGTAAPVEGTEAVRGMVLFARTADVWHMSVHGPPPTCQNPNGEATCTWTVPAVLEAFGADVVELSGLAEAVASTPAAVEGAVRLLNERGIHTYGLGLNAADAARPVAVNVRGTCVVFLGYATALSTPAATPNKPGANAFDPVRLRADIIAARQQGADLVFVTLQYGEALTSTPSGDQRERFHLAADAGADLVIGTHPFVSQPIEFYQGVPLAYSLGPFMVGEPERYGSFGLVLQALVHQGRLLQIRPLIVETGLQPRLLSAAEMLPFLTAIIEEVSP